MQQNNSSQGLSSVTAKLAAARAEAGMVSGLRFPPEDAGLSLAEMAQRDLDAALQLLADRAQYITGATGAAIALRRDGRKDMLCRASSGSNAPELGALLSTEFGLSGESVRTRQLLRCDDAERDARVNQDVCRKLGIASVVVMPVVHDEEVLGVFELFSGHTHAFGDRDVTAVQRLTEMVQTAVRLAHVAEHLPETLKSQAPLADPAATNAAAGAHGAEEILDEEIFSEPANSAPVDPKSSSPETSLKEKNIQASDHLTADASNCAAVTVSGVFEKDIVVPSKASPVQPPPAANGSSAEVAAPVTAAADGATKGLLWSASGQSEADGQQSGDPDQSHVPPVLRGLKKCGACGFPISGGRVLCVECEEKKWRGQLRKASPAASAAVANATAQPPKLEKALAAAVPNSAGTAPTSVASAPATATEIPKIEAQKSQASAVAEAPKTSAVAGDIEPLKVDDPAPTLILSAAAEPSSSWLSAGKYIIGFVVLVAVIVAAVFLLR